MLGILNILMDDDLKADDESIDYNLSAEINFGQNK